MRQKLTQVKGHQQTCIIRNVEQNPLRRKKMISNIVKLDLHKEIMSTINDNYIGIYKYFSLIILTSLDDH